MDITDTRIENGYSEEIAENMICIQDYVISIDSLLDRRISYHQNRLLLCNVNCNFVKFLLLNCLERCEEVRCTESEIPTLLNDDVKKLISSTKQDLRLTITQQENPRFNYFKQGKVITVEAFDSGLLIELLKFEDLPHVFIKDNNLSNDDLKSFLENVTYSGSFHIHFMNWKGCLDYTSQNSKLTLNFSHIGLVQEIIYASCYHIQFLHIFEADKDISNYLEPIFNQDLNQILRVTIEFKKRSRRYGATFSSECITFSETTPQHCKATLRSCKLKYKKFVFHCDFKIHEIIDYIKEMLKEQRDSDYIQVDDCLICFQGTTETFKHQIGILNNVKSLVIYHDKCTDDHLFCISETFLSSNEIQRIEINVAGITHPDRLVLSQIGDNIDIDSYSSYLFNVFGRPYSRHSTALAIGVKLPEAKDVVGILNDIFKLNIDVQVKNSHENNEIWIGIKTETSYISELHIRGFKSDDVISNLRNLNTSIEIFKIDVNETQEAGLLKIIEKINIKGMVKVESERITYSLDLKPDTEAGCLLEISSNDIPLSAEVIKTCRRFYRLSNVKITNDDCVALVNELISIDENWFSVKDCKLVFDILNGHNNSVFINFDQLIMSIKSWTRRDILEFTENKRVQKNVIELLIDAPDVLYDKELGNILNRNSWENLEQISLNMLFTQKEAKTEAQRLTNKMCFLNGDVLECNGIIIKRMLTNSIGIKELIIEDVFLSTEEVDSLIKLLEKTENLSKLTINHLTGDNNKRWNLSEFVKRPRYVTCQKGMLLETPWTKTTTHWDKLEQWIHYRMVLQRNPSTDILIPIVQKLDISFIRYICAYHFKIKAETEMEIHNEKQYLKDSIKRWLEETRENSIEKIIKNIKEMKNGDEEDQLILDKIKSNQSDLKLAKSEEQQGEELSEIMTIRVWEMLAKQMKWKYCKQGESDDDSKVSLLLEGMEKSKKKMIDLYLILDYENKDKYKEVLRLIYEGGAFDDVVTLSRCTSRASFSSRSPLHHQPMILL